MSAYKKFNTEDIWDSKLVAKPHIYFFSGAEYAVSAAVMLQPNSPIDKRFYGWEAGDIQSEVQRFNQTGSLQLVNVDLDDNRYRSVITTLDWHFTRNNEYAPLEGTGLYDGFWHTSSLLSDISATSCYLLDISNVYYGEDIVDGSFILFLDNAYDPRTVDRYYEWAEDDGILLYVSSGSLFTGSASHIEWQPEGRLIYNISESVAHTGSCKVGYVLPEGIIVISGKDSLDSSIMGAIEMDGDTMIVNLYGKHTIPVKTYLCHAPAGKCNASTNDTFYRSGSDGNMYLSGSNQSTVITKVGLYDKKGDLVAVAGLSQPIEKKVDDDILIRIRWDS